MKNYKIAHFHQRIFVPNSTQHHKEKKNTNMISAHIDMNLSSGLTIIIAHAVANKTPTINNIIYKLRIIYNSFFFCVHSFCRCSWYQRNERNWSVARWSCEKKELVRLPPWRRPRSEHKPWNDWATRPNAVPSSLSVKGILTFF